VRFLRVSALTASIAAVAACGSKAAAPTQPTQTPPPTQQVRTLSAPAVSAPVNDTQLTDTAVVLKAGNAQATGVQNVRYRFEWSEADTFPDGSRTGFKDDVEQGGDGTSFQITDTLKPGVKYFWRVRAYAGDVTSDWSATASFVTLNKGYFRGQEVYDPLVNGETVGSRIGGMFVPNQGWKSTNTSDGIDYDIPTCSACTVEFDVTDFGKRAGVAVSKDLKWLSMGDGSTFGNFSVFRNHVWKMHLEQRSDGDGTGMKLIWRNGREGDGDPGDHEGRLEPTMNWRSSAVFHFIITWTQTGYEVSVSEVNADGALTNGRLWFQGGFARPYAPPNHRISLGTRSRSETMPGLFRNVKIYPGPPRPR
jgi:hypothetical protein